MEQNVLLVDDDPNILRALIRSFRNEPFQMFTAHSAEEAIDILKRTRVDVVVSDESMPGISGTEMLVWVAKHFPEIPRVIITGNPTFPGIQNAVNNAGVYKYLTKPVQHHELATVIHDAIRLRARSFPTTDVSLPNESPNVCQP